MNNYETFNAVLAVFAHYGFRKASMEDLAQAVGVTRQTLYNRFKNKEVVLDWAVNGYAESARERASAELRNRELPVETCLLNAFSKWVGDTVAILQVSPHGMEIMDRGMESLRRSDIDHHEIFERDLAQFLQDRGICPSAEAAADTTFLLNMAAKGLLLISENSEAFHDSMARIIRTVIS